MESRTNDLIGKYLWSEKVSIDKILGEGYKCLNRVFEIGKVSYGERPPRAYSHEKKKGGKAEEKGKDKKKRKIKAVGLQTKVVAKKIKNSSAASLDDDELENIWNESVDIQGNVILEKNGGGKDVGNVGVSASQNVEDEVRQIRLIFFLVV